MAFPYLGDFVKALTGWALPLPIPMFGLMVAVAMLTAAWVSRVELRRLHSAGRIGLAKLSSGRNSSDAETHVPPQELVSNLAFLVFFAGIVGARMFHLLKIRSSF
jgi:phosphatidylglycerol---prolipoprotein diacylglyceryl transferase